jgi:hypothetical protein
MKFTPRDLTQFNPLNPMKITRKSSTGERRETLLKEYFVTASLIALLKRVGEEAAKVAPPRALSMVPARIRR